MAAAMLMPMDGPVVRVLLLLLWRLVVGEGWAVIRVQFFFNAVVAVELMIRPLRIRWC
jgi:hypothetical protein